MRRTEKIDGYSRNDFNIGEEIYMTDTTKDKLFDELGINIRRRVGKT